MRAATHLGSDRAAFGAHPFLPGNATDPEAAVPRSHACVREAEESERLRLPFAALHHEIVGVASEKNVPAGMSSPPLVRSQIKDVMQVDVGERGDTVAPCGTPSSGNVHDPFSNAPATSHFSISRRTRRSATRCSRAAPQCWGPTAHRRTR